MGASGSRDRRFGAAVWIVLAAGVGASFVVSPSAASRAANALRHGAQACMPGYETLTLDDADDYAALAARFEPIARDESRDPTERLGAAEVVWAANALARTNLIGDGFEVAFDELLALCDACPDEPAFVALAVTAMRDHRAAIVPGDGAQLRADEFLLESLARTHAAVDPDNGAVPLLLASTALDAGLWTEAADQLTRAACAVVVDEYPLRRLIAAERALIDAGADRLAAREFLVRHAFARAAARTGDLVRSLADRFASANADASTGLALRRVAERVATSTLLRVDAQAAVDVANAVAAPAGNGGQDGRGGDPRQWLARGEVARPIRGIHDLVALCAVGFALLAFGTRPRARASEAATAAAKPARRTAESAPIMAVIFALAAPVAVLVFLAVTRTWPFVRAENSLDVLCAPHPALLALPLASLPFVFGGSFGGSAARGGIRARASRMLWMLAIVYALAFAWTSSAVDDVESQRARALVEQMQFDPDSSSAE
ncbi:MAG: hypothetical protein JNL94_15860 [Planctomycetes bacterium]|nr:hypothetical protein [Planctomycetota bacterium]